MVNATLKAKHGLKGILLAGVVLLRRLAAAVARARWNYRNRRTWRERNSKSGTYRSGSGLAIGPVEDL
jgi:hypothetical protein